MKDERKRDTVHARNPKWAGPLCRFELGVAGEAQLLGKAPKQYVLAQTEGQEEVTCGLCLRLLNRRPPAARSFPRQLRCRWCRAPLATLGACKTPGCVAAHRSRPVATGEPA